MKTKLAAAILLGGLAFLATRIALRLAEIERQDAIPVVEDVTGRPSDLERDLWASDEARRIKWLKEDTFKADGTWVYADPDPSATWKRQMAELGWSDSREAKR